MSKKAHILCVAAGIGEGRYAPAVGFTTLKSPLTEAITGDLWVGPRPHLETLTPAATARDPLTLLNVLGGAFAAKTEGKEIAPDLEAILSGASSISDLLGMGRSEDVTYPAFIQIIPYYLFRNRGRYLRYVRTETGGDARLHGKVSVGVGGHIDLKDVVADAEGRIDLVATLSLAGKREADEEIGARIDDEAFRFIGTIYATDTEVDRVHVGVVGVCDLTDEQAEGLTINEEIGDHAFKTLAEVKAEADGDDTKTLETWTRLVIESNPLA